MSRSPSSVRAPFLTIYATLVYAFLYFPIVVLVLYSFNGSGVGGFPPSGWTLDWYRQLFQDGSLWDSVLNSAIVALIAVGISLTLGLPAALALDRSQFPGKALFRRIVLLPLILPGIITGLSLLMLFVAMGMNLRPCHDHARPRHRPNIGRDYRNLCWLAKARSRPGRSLARPWRESVENVLAHHAPQSPRLFDRRCPADFHALA